jgi:streptomycin 6-kinase
MERVEKLMRDWQVVAENTLETNSSIVVFGKRGELPVVLKVARQPGDEWHCGRVVQAFEGSGMVRAYASAAGAVLLERLHPANSLADLALNGRDDEATEILAEVLKRLSHPQVSAPDFATVQEWGSGFERYLTGNDEQIPRALVAQGQQMYAELCASQQDMRLLHGDLHHYNVLFDDTRGWTAIDPKGVVGEIEYEIGASLRNPFEGPELFCAPATIERRLRQYENGLKIDGERALRWGFAQAILSAVWSVEDGFSVDNTHPSMRLAVTMRLMLGG